MSRRATRRLMAAGAALVLVAALVVGVLLTRAPSSEASPQGERPAAESTAPRNADGFPVYYLGERSRGSR